MPMLTDLLARVLSLAVDIAAWGLDRFADEAEDAADAARFFAHLTRCCP